MSYVREMGITSGHSILPSPPRLRANCIETAQTSIVVRQPGYNDHQEIEMKYLHLLYTATASGQ